jgi:hypothetical protein
LSVFVLDKRKRPVMPCCKVRARLFLERGRAVVRRRHPFTIRLKDRVDVEPVRVKLDPGSRTTGIAIVADEDGNKPAKVLCLFELAHYEIREYVFEKFGPHCAYCGITDVPLNLDHIHPRSRGGSNRGSNLFAACIPCNTDKGARPIEEFLAGKPALLSRIKAQAGAPPKDAVSATTLPTPAASTACIFGIPSREWCLVQPPDEASTGKPVSAKASYKAHRVALVGWQQPMLAIKASGRGDYLTKLTAHGLPRGSCMRTKSVRGFQTGDMVRAEVSTGKKAGTHVGRVAVEGSGSFRVGNAEGINAKYCKLLHRTDGYCYARQATLLPRPEERGFQRGRL